MISGTFTVATSDDSRFVVGSVYPLTIDDPGIELTIQESVTASVPVATTATPSTTNEAALPGADTQAASSANSASTPPATA